MLSLLLVDFVIRFDMMKNLGKNINALGMTAMLFLIVLFVFTSVGFFYFHERIYMYSSGLNDPDLEGASLCDTMVQWYSSMIDIGIRIGEGVAMNSKPVSYLYVYDYYIFLIYGMAFFLVIGIVIFNIIFGLIIDTFAQVRNEKRAIELDQLNRCYIWNIDRYVFDQDGKGFEDHCKNDHNMWNYIFYIVHLQTKDPTEFNGVESYVWNKLNTLPDPNKTGDDTEESNWVPLLRAMVIDTPKEVSEVDNQQEIRALKQLKKWYKRLKRISAFKNKLISSSV